MSEDSPQAPTSTPEPKPAKTAKATRSKKGWVKKAGAAIAVIAAAAVGGTQLLGQGEPFSNCVDKIEQAQPASGGFSYLVRWVGGRYNLQPADAWDAIADTLLAVCQKTDVRDVVPYYMKALENHATDFYRRKQMCGLGSIKNTCSAGVIDPSNRTACWEEAARANRAFCRLNLYEQTLIRLRYIEEEDYAAIAAKLSISESTAKRHVKEALDKLRAKFLVLE